MNTINICMKSTHSHAFSSICIVLLLALQLNLTVQAAPPLPFIVTYKASYGNFNAEAARQMTFEEQSNTYTLQAEIKLMLLGNTLSSITETSIFLWHEELPVPIRYEYVQKGLGGRKRSVEFDQEAHTAHYNNNESIGSLALSGTVLDDMSAYVYLRQQLREGATEIHFDAVDRDTIKSYHYRVMEKTILSTTLGNFETVKLARVRLDNPERVTEIWLAEDFDYMLLKLLQVEPDDSTIRLDVDSASLAGKPLAGL